MLKIKIPNILQIKQTYALDILLGEFLGLDYEVETYESDIIEISKANSFDKISKLTINASFFIKGNQKWLETESMPNLPLKDWIPFEDRFDTNLVEPSIPVLYGLPGIIKNEKHIHLNLDIFGSAFFMLSRYEELISKKLDNHDRFPAKESISCKANFLDRPIIDEYTEILWSCLTKLWPDLERKNFQSEISLSCDVDQPFDCSVETLPKL